RVSSSPLFLTDPSPVEHFALSLHDALPICKLGGAHRHDLDVIAGGAGALGDARDRRALRRKILCGGGRDDPFGEHAAALAAKRRSEEHTSELQSLTNLVCRLLLSKKKTATR